MDRAPFVLVLGGARSGKSRLAEQLATQRSMPVTYLATAGAPRDEEMAERIAAHRVRRPAAWTTIEEPTELAPILSNTEGLVLVDCLTLWLTNVMLSGPEGALADPAAIDLAVARLAGGFTGRRGPVVAVSNEVGEGIVPSTPLGRAFRDRQGVLNQEMARLATTVILVVAGCPLVVKPSPQPELSF